MVLGHEKALSKDFREGRCDSGLSRYQVMIPSLLRILEVGRGRRLTVRDWFAIL